MPRWRIEQHEVGSNANSITPGQPQQDSIEGMRPLLVLLLSCLAEDCLFAQQPPVTPSSPAPAKPRNAIDEFSDTVERLIRQVNPTVIEIITEGFGGVEDEANGGTNVVARRTSLGTGVFLSADGDVITNAHVVKGARKVRVRLTEAGGSEDAPRVKYLDADILGIDSETDLALLKVTGTRWNHLKLADSTSLRQGQIVFAVGSPRGLENSISMGVVSSAARQISPDANQVFIQTDAPINPGNSGGPLINSRGEVVGINTFIITESGGSEGLGFAIPSNVVLDVYSQLKKYGRVRRGELGVIIRTVTPALVMALGLSRDQGVLVQDVISGKAAATAGLLADDIVVRVEGRTVRNIRQFSNSMFRSHLGGELTLDVVRGQQTLKIQVPFTENTDPNEFLAERMKEQSIPIPQLGILAIPLNAATAPLITEPRYRSGVIVVAKLQSNGLHEELQPGDVIYGVNGKLTSNIEVMKEILSTVADSAPLVMRVQRGPYLRYFVLKGE